MTRSWLIDAMNVIGSRPDRWWNDPDRAMRSLVQTLEDYARITGEDVTVVFDKAPKPPPATTSARLVFASRRGRDAADHEIVDLVAGAEDPGTLSVVTSDKALRERVSALGARLVSSRAFRDRVDRALTTRHSV